MRAITKPVVLVTTGAIVLTAIATIAVVGTLTVAQPSHSCRSAPPAPVVEHQSPAPRFAKPPPPPPVVDRRPAPAPAPVA